MFTPSGSAKCKTCGCEIEAGELRCAPHEREFKRWLARQDSSPSSEYYTPRVDGMRGLELRGTLNERQRIIYSLYPGLKPGEPLNFSRKAR
jgi:hypothetical protein